MLHFNVSNGSTCFSSVDFSLPGFIPFDFERTYKSNLNYCGCLGWNWATPLDAALFETTSGFSFRDQWGYSHALKHEKNTLPDQLFRFSRTEHDLIVTTPQDIRWRFFKGREAYLAHRIEDGSGNAITFDYDSNGLIQVITDSLGRRVVVRHAGGRIEEFQFLPKMGDRSPRTLVRYAYDGSNNLVAVWDANGNACRFEYEGHLIVHYQNRIGGSQYASYDPLGRCVHLWRSGGEQAKSIRYDDRRRTAAVINSRGTTTLYRWNEAGSVTEEVNIFGAVTSKIFDDGNALIATLDERGNPKLTTIYDEKARTLVVTDASGATSSFQHDDHGRVQWEVDACGAKWQWFYDTHGRVERVVRPSGAETRLTYDSSGFLIARTDRRGNTIIQTRAEDGTRLTLTDSLGLLMEYRYDELGRYAGAADAAGERCSLQRDTAGRLLECRWPDNSRIQYAYDAEENLTHVVDELGNRAAFSFDLFGRCQKYTNPLGDSIRFHYDTEGEIVAVTNERGELYRFDYDLLGRVVHQVFPDGNHEYYVYDDHGDLIRIIQGDETSIDFIYSPVGRIAAKSYSDGTTEQFSYDPLRRLTLASNSETTIQLKWDQDGNLVQEKQGNYTLNHLYDPAGNRIQSRDSAGRIIGYNYDARGHLISTTDSITGTHEFEYGAAGLLRRHTFPNGAILDSEYDVRKRTIGQRLHNVTDRGVSASYEFDHGGRLVAQRTLGGTGEQLRYDACEHLLELRHPDRRVERYRYDAEGNIVELPTYGNLSYAAGNRLVASGDSFFAYDPRGSLVEQATGEERTRFVYDVGGRLTKLIRDDSTLASYTYDALGRRIAKSVDGVITTFRWNGFVLHGEEGPAGNTAFLCDESSFLPLSRSSSGRVEHFVTDRRGCVAAMLDDSASVTGTFEFDAFGGMQNSPSNGPSHPFRLRGQYFDTESGLHYNLQRYYHPSTARFLTRDPLGIAAGLNLYKYGPNTFTWEDPFGLESECQGDVFYRAMSSEEKQKVLADCQLHSRQSQRCPEGPYVTQAKKYCESAMREKRDKYEHLAEICTQPGTVNALQNSPYTGINGSQAKHWTDWPRPLPAITSGQVDRIEMKWERLGEPDEGLNYGLSKGEGLKTFNSKVESMKFTPSGETCTKA
jgi:RHS repeat-associated protein